MILHLWGDAAVFSSTVFLFRFLPVFLAVYYLTPERWRDFILFIGSMVLYACGDPGHTVLLIALTVINVLSPSEKTFSDAYKQFIEFARRCQPDAIICIEGIMHVTGSIASSAPEPAIANTNLVQRNEALLTPADGRDVICIDRNSAVCGGDGNLIEDDSADGVHLTASELRHQFLKENAIVR